MLYADYKYYRDIFHGTMPEGDFLRLSRQATAYLDQVTGGRIDEEKQQWEKIKDACCAVSDVYYLNEHGGGVASETNDGISVNYVAGVSNTKTEGQRLYEAVALYLGGTGLLYRGVN